VERDLHQYQSVEDVGRHEPFIELTERGVRDVVKRTAERAAEETGDEDFRHVSSHDLRRRFAQRLLVDKQVNPRVVMADGRWVGLLPSDKTVPERADAVSRERGLSGAGLS